MSSATGEVLTTGCLTRHNAKEDHNGRNVAGNVWFSARYFNQSCVKTEHRLRVLVFPS